MKSERESGEDGKDGIPTEASEPAEAAGADEEPDAEPESPAEDGSGTTEGGAEAGAEAAPESEAESESEAEDDVPAPEAGPAPVRSYSPDAAEPEPDPQEAGGARAWWRRPVVLSASAVAVIGVLTLVVVVQSPSAKAGADATTGLVTKATHGAPLPTSQAPTTGATATASAPTTAPAATTAPPASPSPSPTPTVAPTKDPAPSLKEAVEALRGSGVGSLSVAVSELDGSHRATYSSSGNANGTFDTASIVKVDILATLLLQTQHAGTGLSARERNLATSMIEDSDNDSALALWQDIGRGAGLRAGNDTLGLAHTTGGPGDLWGLTQTTAADQLTLMRAVFTTDSPLSTASRSYVTRLMHSISPGQRWGVSAADSEGDDFALKNGWLPRSATGLWDVNSVGEVRYHGHTLLICVLSEGQYSEGAGIGLVERAALAAAKTAVG